MILPRMLWFTFFASQGKAEPSSKEGAIFVNRVAERFSELEISTVRIARLDMARFSPPTAIQIDEIPCIAIFPAFSKDPPHRIFRGKLRPPHVMWWVERHASLKFKLPDLPHLDEIETKAYWKQKAQLSPEKQKQVAVESEGSVRRRHEL